jgi:hypothetical protein
VRTGYDSAEEGGMTEPEQVPSDLTLELGGNLSPARFLGATRAFFGCVEELSRAVAPDGEAPTWTVRIREGSHLIGVDPAPGVRAQLVREVYARMKHGVEQLAAGEIDAARLPDAAIRHLKNLSEYAERPHKQSVTVRIWVEKKAVALGSDVIHAIVESWEADYRDYGTIEGRLEAIQDHDALKIRVRDAALRQSIPCYVPENKLPDAFANFRKRVEVSGLIHYRRNGVPVSIEVNAIAPIPDDAELPSIDDVRGILRTDV